MSRSILAAALLFALALAPAAAAAPPLAPPPGPPGPTMKRLDVVEPRIPITQADIPLTITQPGSYYLAANITAPHNQIAITILAPNVTLDFEGFTLTGSGTNAIAALLVNGSSAVVRNGRIVNAAVGIDALNSTGCRVESLVIANAPPFSTAVGVAAGSYTLISRCRIDNLGATTGHIGVFVSAGRQGVVLEHSVISRCGVGVIVSDAPNAHIHACTITGGVGLGNTAVRFAGASNACVISECRVTNWTFGVIVDAAVLRSAVVRNVATGCGTSFGGVPNVSTNPAAAAPNDNLAF